MEISSSMHKMKMAFAKLNSEVKTPEQKKQLKEVFSKFNKYASGGETGIKKGVAYFQNLQSELIKKGE